jgi:hypothetical protein
MSGLLVFGLITAIILVFDLAVTAFGVDSRPGVSDERFGALS